MSKNRNDNSDHKMSKSVAAKNGAMDYSASDCSDCSNSMSSTRSSNQNGKNGMKNSYSDSNQKNSSK